MDTYRSGDATIRIAAHEPAGKGPFPALLLLHGSGGALSYWLDRFAPLLAQSGYAVYAPHYFEKTGTQRATPEMILDGRHFPEWLAAARDALGYISQQPRADARRIGVIGISLGAYLAVATAIDDDRVRSVVELSGGVPPGWEKRVSPSLAPTMIIHGDRDSVVPVSEARKLEGLLQLHKVRYSTEIFPEETHWFSSAAQLKLLVKCAQFLSTNL
jgi:carboxymethylenebutenolidase